MGWQRSGHWPGRGPFSFLPPWQRPGWLYGRGACWWLSAPSLKKDALQVSPATIPPTPVPTKPFVPTFTKEQERQMLEQQMKNLEEQLDAVRKKLEELSR